MSSTYDLKVTWLRRFLFLFIAIEAIAFISSVLQFVLLTHPPIEAAAAQANDRRESTIGVFYLLIYITTAVLFCHWTVRAHKKVRVLGATGMPISPGWAVGYYFIPFINLVRPYKAMKDLWKASQNPKDWISQDVSPLLWRWWTLWLLSNVISNVSFRMHMEIDSLASAQGATIAALIDAPVSIWLTATALRMVTQITEQVHESERTLQVPPVLPSAPSLVG